MYLIVSGTGRVGRAVAQTLLQAGKPVRVLARTPARADDLRAMGAEVVKGDLTDPASIGRACRGATRVLATAHALMGRGANSSYKVDMVGNRAMIEVARTAEVQHYVFISARGSAPDHPVPFFRYKHAGEQHLRQSGLSYSILRPTAFMEIWGDMVGGPILTRGKTTIFGRGENPINFVSERDVVALAVQALDDPALRGRTVDVGGPENLTMNELAARYARAAGVTPKISRLPRRALRLIAALAEPLHPGVAQVMRAALDMDTSDQIFYPVDLPQVLGRPLTTIDEVIQASLALRRRSAAQV